MSRIFDPDNLPTPTTNTQCFGCYQVEGAPKYGIRICKDCDQRIFIQPYGGRDVDEPVSSLDLRADTTGTGFDELSVIYRFSKKDTLISAKIRNRSFPLMIIPKLMPMTQAFLARVTLQARCIKAIKEESV